MNHGKSTLTSFIKSIFYGVNKNKNGQEVSEQDKYKPWSDSSFSGSISYNHLNEDYIVSREFKNNSTKIFRGDGEDISSLYSKDKSRGIDVGFEQFGVDEETFVSTMLVGQNNLKVDVGSQHSILQKLSNTAQSGKEDVSYEDICHKLNKILRDDIGTDRSSTKPKLILKKEIDDLKQKEDRLINSKERHEEIVEELSRILEKKDAVESELGKTRDVLDIKSKYEKEIQNQRMKFDAEQSAKNKSDEDQRIKDKRNMIIDTIIIMLLTTVLAIVLITIANSFLFAALSILVGIVASILNVKIMYKDKIEISNDDFDLVAEDIRKKQIKEITSLEKNGYSKKITEKGISELKKDVVKLESNRNEIELDIHKLKIEDELLSKNVNDLIDIHEDLYFKENELAQLLEKEATIELALQVLSDSYEELKMRVIPRLEKDVSYAISKTTKDAYSKILFNDKDGIVTYNKYGEVIRLSMLSQGTIDEMYLGFRLAISDKYNSLPIIFDESFVYFDNNRLQNILKVISEMSEDRQIIIMSCSDREKNILDNLRANYNEITV